MSFTALVGVAKRKGMHLDIYPSTVQKYLFACMSKTQLRSHKTKHMFPPSLPHTTYCPNPIALVCHMPQKPTHWYCPNPIALKYSEAYKVNLFIKKCFPFAHATFEGFLTSNILLNGTTISTASSIRSCSTPRACIAATRCPATASKSVSSKPYDAKKELNWV